MNQDNVLYGRDGENWFWPKLVMKMPLVKMPVVEMQLAVGGIGTTCACVLQLAHVRWTLLNYVNWW